MRRVLLWFENPEPGTRNSRTRNPERGTRNDRLCQPRLFNPGSLTERIDDRREVLAAVSLTSCATERLARSGGNRDRHFLRIRGIDDERQILVREIDRESRRGIALQDLGRPGDLQL